MDTHHHEYLTSLGLDADYAATATTIEPLDLGAELARVCADLAWWGVLTAQLEAEATRAKRTVKETEAMAARAAYQAGKSTTGKAPGTTQVDAAVASTREVQSAHMDHMAAEERWHAARAVLDGVRAKATLVQSLGALTRAEMQLTR